MTWFVLILLVIRTLVGVPKDGVKIDVYGRWREIVSYSADVSIVERDV